MNEYPVAGQGLTGDRYLGVAAHYDAQVTFVAREVFHALQTEFGRADWSPILMRRNIVIEGVPLIQPRARVQCYSATPQSSPRQPPAPLRAALPGSTPH